TGSETVVGVTAASVLAGFRLLASSSRATTQSALSRRTRYPRNAGLARERGTDPLSNFAGLGVTRPALEETPYFPPTVVGDRRAEVALGPRRWRISGNQVPAAMSPAMRVAR